jgi:hypothetical protein
LTSVVSKPPPRLVVYRSLRFGTPNALLRAFSQRPSRRMKCKATSAASRGNAARAGISTPTHGSCMHVQFALPTAFVFFFQIIPSCHFRCSCSHQRSDGTGPILVLDNMHRQRWRNFTLSSVSYGHGQLRAPLTTPEYARTYVRGNIPHVQCSPIETSYPISSLNNHHISSASTTIHIKPQNTPLTPTPLFLQDLPKTILAPSYSIRVSQTSPSCTPYISETLITAITHLSLPLQNRKPNPSFAPETLPPPRAIPHTDNPGSGPCAFQNNPQSTPKQTSPTRHIPRLWTFSFFGEKTVKGLMWRTWRMCTV